MTAPLSLSVAEAEQQQVVCEALTFFFNGWLLTTASSGELEEDYCVRFKCRKRTKHFFDKQPEEEALDQFTLQKCV